MRIDSSIVVALAALSLTAPLAAAPAATLTDDVRCLMVSTGYVRLAKDEETRRAAATTGAFFLGRLSDRLTDPAVAAAIRAQGTGMRGDQAQPVMRACAARAGAADQALTGIAAAAQRR